MYSEREEIRSPLTLGEKKWSLYLEGRANVKAKILTLTIIKDGKPVKLPIAPDYKYLLRVNTKKKNHQGEFEIISRGNHNTNGHRENVGLLNKTSVDLDTHICLNRFNLSDFKIEAKGDVTNKVPKPPENANASVSL